MKIKIVIIVSILVLLLSFFFIRKPSFNKRMDELMENMDSYMLEGVMEVSKGENIKKYNVEVGYKKEKEEYFKVSIHDISLNQTQVILRNKDGVFVVTPTLNQIFKFEGDWPLNSLKPYLIQSMYEIIKSDTTNIEKKDKEYYIKSPVNYPNNKNFKEQEMYFDEDLKIRSLNIYDENNTVVTSITFNKVNYNKNIKNEYFDLPKEKSEVSAQIVEENQLPLYPVQIFDSSLKSNKVLNTDTGTKYILEYEGDKSFTLIQSVKKPSKELETVIMSGTLVDVLDSFGFYDTNYLQYYASGVDYTLYSNDLSLEEMVEVLNSVQVVVMK